MLSSNIPAKLAAIWASLAGASYVRTIPVTTADPTAASLDDGFPPATATAIAAGGTPPDIRDFNGAFQILSAWAQWQSVGGPIFYDAAQSSNVGGYPKWAMLSNASTVGSFWISTVDNNTSDPDTGGANWYQFPPIGTSPVTSFNGRNGAVTLTSSDVVNALATNALANAKLAQMAAGTVKANITGAGATPADVTLAALAAAFPSNSFTRPQLTTAAAKTVVSNLSGSTAALADNSLAAFMAAAMTITTNSNGTCIQIGPVYFQFGQVAAVSENTSPYTQTLPVTFPTGPYPGAYGATVVATTDQTDNAGQVQSCSTSSIVLWSQYMSGGAGGPGNLYPLNWWAIGH